jgi:two-component sensor histidine kinase
LTECDVAGCRFITSCVDGIMVVDAAGIIRYANPAAQQLFDRTWEELLGKPFGSPVLVGEAAELNLVQRGGAVGVVEMRTGAVEWQGAEAFLVTLRDITTRKRAEERIVADLREKEVLLKEIHHRVKNNLQVVSSLLNLQKEQVHDLRDGELLQECRNRVRAMALVHDTLYRSSDLSRIEFREYLEILLVDLTRACLVEPGRITVRMIGEPVTLGIDTAVPCGIIVNELVTNALRHAFPEERSGVIEVNLTQENDVIRITVTDNGAGMPSELDPTTSDTLGFNLVTILVGQIGGNLAVTSSPQGTAFSVRFKG